MITMNLYGVPIHNCERNLLDFKTGEERYYYRLRGKPVTPEQAFEIIRRTDTFMRNIDQIYWRDDHVGGDLFPSYFFTRRHTPNGFSWAHLDGTIGINYHISLAFAKMKAILEEWSYIAKAFPYLDLVIAITNWDEYSYEAWEHDDKGSFELKYNSFYELDAREHDALFYEDIQIGLRIRNGELELLDKEDAVKTYKEYAELYEAEPREKYKANYYQELAQRQDSPELLRQAIRDFGLDPDKVTSFGRPLIFAGGESDAV